MKYLEIDEIERFGIDNLKVDKETITSVIEALQKYPYGEYYKVTPLYSAKGKQVGTSSGVTVEVVEGKFDYYNNRTLTYVEHAIVHAYDGTEQEVRQLIKSGWFTGKKMCHDLWGDLWKKHHARNRSIHEKGLDRFSLFVMSVIATESLELCEKLLKELG